MIDAETLRALLDYDPEAGLFTRRVTTGGAIAGSVAGSTDSYGYKQISVRGRLYLSHRLAWLYAYGEWPAGDIDHVDGDRTNNRLENLRMATRSQNCANAKRRGGAACLKGVSRHGGRYQARVNVNGVRIHLGTFATEQQAHEAYCAAAAKVFGPYHRAG